VPFLPELSRLTVEHRTYYSCRIFLGSHGLLQQLRSRRLYRPRVFNAC